VFSSILEESEMKKLMLMLVVVGLVLVGSAQAVPANLATSGTATDSSYHIGGGGSGPSYLPSYTNDGIRAGVAPAIWHSSTSPTPHYLEVDLGSDNHLDRVQIFHRTDGLDYQNFTNFQVQVWNNLGTEVYNQTFDTGETATYDTWGSIGLRGTLGQTVRLTELGADQYVQMGEFEVFGQSLAPTASLLSSGATVTGTAPLAGTNAALANLTDGSIDGDWGRPDDGGSGAGMYHSNEIPAFIQVDLGSVQSIEYINLFDRTDDNSSSSITVEVLAGDGTTVLDSTTFDLSGIANYDHVWTLGSAVNGQYVKVSNTGTWMALSEVEVFGVVPEPATMALLGLGSLVLIRRKKA